MNSIPHLGYKGGNRDYCSHLFSVTFKFVIVSVRLILSKGWDDGFSGQRWESEVR